MAATERTRPANEGRGPVSENAETATFSRSDPTPAQSDPGLAEVLLPAEQPEEMGRLGPYRILSVLGVGGMGIVLKAEDSHLQRLVALKVMRPSIAASADSRARFLREARAAAALYHDH